MFRRVLHLFMRSPHERDETSKNREHNTRHYFITTGVLCVGFALTASWYLYMAVGLLCGSVLLFLLGLELYDILLCQWCLHLARKLIQGYEDFKIAKYKFTVI